MSLLLKALRIALTKTLSSSLWPLLAHLGDFYTTEFLNWEEIAYDWFCLWLPGNNGFYRWSD